MNLPEADAAAPSIVSFANLDVTVETRSETLDVPPELSIESTSLKVDGPKVVSIPCRAPRVAVKTYVFPEAPEWAVAPPPEKKPPAEKEAAPAEEQSAAAEGEDGEQKPGGKKQATRIKPPSDVIKLQDRLYYLLQPSLESLVSAGELEFPFEPFPYQFEGIAFLFPRHAAVLADEMGLGKTMQAISTMRMLIRSGEARNILLICPKPLVTNWKREFATWAPEIPVSIIEGDQARRTWQWQSAEAPVKIANYELMMRDQAIVNDESLRFDLVVLDEAQRIKNSGSTTAQIVRAIPRDRSWALTGTPIENCTDDLVGIFEFLVPGYLYKGMPLKQLCTATSEYIIRRTKDMVLEDMPPRLYRDADLSLSPAQQETYELAENEGIVRLEKMGEELTVQHVFELVLRLKQICNFDPRTGDSSKMEQLRNDMEEVAASGKKAIVFSQWTQTIEQIRKQLEPFGPLEYHGKIPSKHRDGVIDQFKHDPSKHVILMSYGAGSVGLNLQFCEYVFLFDRWWNPAIEDQAINRAHRIGAKGAVTVSRYLAMNTIETRIDQVLNEKRELFNTLFAEAGTPQPGGLSKDEIFGLFNLRSPKGPIRLAA
ncbi:DEAD/DEAH box helicase [Blastopirellula marina]|uniref:Helicase n=1 Tax=Blastopirellula marina TaxID=124 RepID=A0A2S8FWF0_9BACT|nr:DEAD/DEAH box helicase [Blastopirellula marina]PQO36506.1 helicase [Blastopirellula marina]PTL44344.1 ATP-dependent helicase [Blastopirellula marina]